MTGTEFTARDRFPPGILIAMVVLGLCLWAAFLPGEELNGWHVIAAGPAIFIVLRLLLRRRAQHLRLTPEGIESRNGDLKIPYTSITGVTIDGHLHEAGTRIKKPLVINHDAGQLVIPHVVTGANVDDVYAHLRGNLSPRAPKLPPALVSHFQNELAKFGPQRVFAYDVRPMPRRREKGRGTRVCGFAMTIAGMAGFIIGFAIEEGGSTSMVAAGFTSFFVGVITWLIGISQTQDLHPAKKCASAGMVISPSSFALSQGALSGTLRWEEIRRVRLATRGSFQLSSVSTRTGIFIEPAGTIIHVADIYTIPRSALMKLIESYWRPPTA